MRESGRERGAEVLNLVEIFWSVQGEGIWVGEPSVFVRLGECDLRCAWCDSPETWQRADRCQVESAPGSRCFDVLENPIACDFAIDAVLRLSLGPGGLVSVTGGEPLLQPLGVKALAAPLRKRGLRVLLETHGLAVAALERVIDHVDCVSMDWKLTSSVRRVSDPRNVRAGSFHDEHDAFLRCAARGRAVCVKVVLTANTEDEEIDEVCRRIAACAPDTPLVLQPVTPAGTVRDTPSPERLLAWLRRCRQKLPDVRLIPQTHKALGVL